LKIIIVYLKGKKINIFFSFLHKSSKDSAWIVSGIELIAIVAGKPESEHSIQHGGHVRNQK